MGTAPKNTEPLDAGVGITIGLKRVEPHVPGGAPMAMLSLDLGERTLFIQLDVGGVLQLANKLLSFAAAITVDQLDKTSKENPRGI